MSRNVDDEKIRRPSFEATKLAYYSLGTVLALEVSYQLHLQEIPLMPKFLVVFAVLSVTSLAAYGDSTKGISKKNAKSGNAVQERIGHTTVIQRKSATGSSSSTRSRNANQDKSSIQPTTTARRFRVKGYKNTAEFVHHVLGFKSRAYVSGKASAKQKKASESVSRSVNKRIRVPFVFQ